ncbi:MAG: GNAT family N-acetyltransferase [Chloroflexi bacterium]|nr:GNAT family N-acetyltransferase [Chloroflexota bacterium]
MLTSLLIQHAIESGHRIFDFLQGDEVYKYRFGAADTKIMRAQFQR